MNSPSENARRLQQKATSCIRIAERILPGAKDFEIEEMAVALMHIPDNALTVVLKQIQCDSPQ